MKQFDTNHTRYLRQRDQYSCSAIALLNLDKWRGIRVTQKNLAQYKKLCHADVLTGVERRQFESIVGRKGRKLSYTNLKKHHGAVILETEWTDGHKHSYLILGWATDGKRYGWLAVNYWIKSTYSLIPSSAMRWLLKRSVAWLFKK
jgi:hypothetical protein